MKKSFLRTFGFLLTFFFSSVNVFAQELGIDFASDLSLYGVGYEPELTIWERIWLILLSPISIIIILILVFVIGFIVYFRKKSKNNKKKDDTKNN